MKLSDPTMRRFISKETVEECFEGKSELILDMCNIPKEYSQYVRVLDKNEEHNLYLLHYLEPFPEIQHVRGLIIKDLGESYEIVCTSYPYTFEIPFNDFKQEYGHLGLTSSVEVTYAYEGTVLRAFYSGDKSEDVEKDVQGRWFISTHKKIDGSNSRWEGPTFGTVFDRIVGDSEGSSEEFFNSLNRDYCYNFLISYAENKLGFKTERDSLRLTSVYSKSKTFDDLERVHPWGYLDSIPGTIFILEIILNGRVGTFDENSFENDKIGIVLYNKEKNSCVKCLSGRYLTNLRKRGKERNPCVAYLDRFRKNGDTNFLKEFYPEKTEEFTQVVSKYEKLTEYLTALYTERYINKNFKFIHNECHKFLENTRNNFDSNLSLDENITAKILVQPTKTLYKIIKSF